MNFVVFSIRKCKC